MHQARVKLIYQDNTCTYLNPSASVRKIIAHIQCSGKCSIKKEEMQLFADGKEIDMSQPLKRLTDLEKIPVLLNIGRIRNCIPIDSRKMEKEKEELNDCLSAVRDCPRMKGYCGHVPGNKFGYGLPQTQLDLQHLKPSTDIVNESEIHEGHTHPCQGYDGYIRGAQHVAGRTWSKFVQETVEHDLEELVITPSIQASIPCRRITTLETMETPEILKLLTPPQSPLMNKN